MLTGTLVTAAGFLPIATAQSSVGEFTRSIFQVVTIALVISWFAAVIVIPYLGFKLLPDHVPHDPKVQKVGFLSRLLKPVLDTQHHLAEGFYRWFRHLIQTCVAYPLTVIVLTVATFAGSIFLFQFVQQQFFPDSTRMELMVDLKLPEGSSLQATASRNCTSWKQYLNTQQDHIENFVAYVGNGSPRFYLPLDQQLPAASFAQFVITTKSIADREALRSKLIDLLDNNPAFSLARGRVIRLENGPPVGYPVQFRVSGDDLWKLRELGEQVASVMRANPHLVNVHLDWNERSKAIRLKLDTAKAISLGVTQSALSQLLQSTLSGTPIGEFREQDQTIPILLRGAEGERDMISRLAGLNVPTVYRQNRAIVTTGKHRLRAGRRHSLASQPHPYHHGARRHLQQDSSPDRDHGS